MIESAAFLLFAVFLVIGVLFWGNIGAVCALIVVDDRESGPSRLAALLGGLTIFLPVFLLALIMAIPMEWKSRRDWAMVADSLEQEEFRRMHLSYLEALGRDFRALEIEFKAMRTEVFT